MNSLWLSFWLLAAITVPGADAAPTADAAHTGLASSAARDIPVIHLPVEDEKHEAHLQGETYRKEIAVVNKGTVPLNISKVLGSCQCIEIVEYDKEIQPGATGKVTIDVDTKKIPPGDSRKQVRIFSDDPYTPKALYWFDTDVIAIFRTNPRTISISGVVDQPKFGEVDLLAGSDLGFEIVELKSREGKFKIVESELVEKDKRYRVKLEVPPADAPGKEKGILDMTIKVRDGRVITIGTWVEIEHRPHILVQPGKIFYSNKDTNRLLVDDPKPVTKNVMVAGTVPETTFTIKNVKVVGAPEGVFETKVKPLIDGKRYQVSVILSEYQKKSYISGKLVIETSDSRLPELSLDLRAMFGRRRK